MKNPLVDALRQAGDTRDDSTPVEKPVAKSPDDEVGGDQLHGLLDSAGAGELSLLESNVLVVESGSDAPENDEAADAVPTESADDVVVEQPSHAEEGATSQALPAKIRSGAECQPGLARIGFYSPLLCLVLASAATGTHFLYQQLGGRFQNADLATLSSQLEVRGSAATSAAPDGPVQRFKLIVDDTGPSGSADSTARNAAAAPAAVVLPALDTTAVEVPDTAFASLNDAYAAYASGDFAGAEAAYRQALQIAPSHPNALHGLAAILHRSGRIDTALQYYERLLSVEPDNTAAAAALLAGRNDSPSAATASEIKHLLQRHPDSAPLYNALGARMANQRRWPDARLAYDNALAIDPHNAEYRFNLAVSLEHLGFYEDARAQYEIALQDVSNNSAIDSDTVVARIAMIDDRSARPGQVQ